MPTGHHFLGAGGVKILVDSDVSRSLEITILSIRKYIQTIKIKGFIS